jgi:hypothetical protein
MIYPPAQKSLGFSTQDGFKEDLPQPHQVRLTDASKSSPLKL